jgi:hypothetical protein
MRCRLAEMRKALRIGGKGLAHVQRFAIARSNILLQRAPSRQQKNGQRLRTTTLPTE